jgi:hypothetical protein
LIQVFGTSVLTIPEVVVICLVLALYLVRGRTYFSETVRMWKPYTLPVFLIFCGGVGGVIFSGHVLKALIELKTWFIFPIAFAFVLSGLIVFTGSWLRRAGLIFILILMAGLSAQQLQKVNWATQIQVWETALVVSSDQPLSGIGFDNFPARYTSRVADVVNGIPKEWGVSNPHSIYLSSWLYGGIVGIIGLLTFILLSVRHKRIEFLPFYLYCILGLISTMYFYGPGAYVFWAVIMFGVAVPRHDTHRV